MAPPNVTTRRGAAAALGLVLLATAACPPRKGTGGNDGVIATGGSDSFPTDFTPGDALPPPDPPDPATFGLSYLEQMAPRLQAGWAQFLEDCRLRLPPQHALNSPTLTATIALVVDGQGALVGAEVVAPSGNAEFDDAALGVANDAAPFPAVDVALRSDDDQVYVTWLFARDRRQAGTATASLRRVEWSLDRAVPKFLDDRNLAEAARRVARAAGDDPPAPVLALGERVMIAAVREGLASPDPGVQRAAIAAAADAKIRPAARELRAIADGALDVSLRGAAIGALASVGDTDATPLLVAILERDAGANVDLTGSAARALTALGAGDDAARIASAWLAEGKGGNKTAAQKARLWAALIAAGGVPMPKAIPDLGRLVGSGEPRVRGAACRALATTAVVDASAWKPLGRGLADPDALVRSTCATAVADAAAAGGKSRATFWLVAPLLRDRDERVRAAAVLALARLDAPRGAPELAAIARDKSPLVQASLAEAWVRAGDVERAAALLTHELPAVRLAAATALAGGNAAAQAKVAAHTDADPAVRALVLAAATDRGALEAASTDADPTIAAAAARRLVLLDGRAKALAPTAGAVADAPPAGAVRVSLAGAWLAAK